MRVEVLGPRGSDSKANCSKLIGKVSLLVENARSPLNKAHRLCNALLLADWFPILPSIKSIE
jgi:hypothetical protein